MKKRETPAQNIAFISLIAGINIVLVTLFRFVPLSAIFLVLVLPFFSTVVVLLCKTRYVFIYAFTTIAVTLLISLENSLFYILTPLLSGIAFGVCYKKYLHRSYAIGIASMITLALFYATMPLFEFVLKVKISDSFKMLFNLTDDAVTIIFPAFVIMTSIMQNIISFIIVDNELVKYLDIDINKEIPYNIIGIVLTSLSLLAIGLSFVYIPLALALGVINLFLMVYSIKKIIVVKKYWLFAIVLGLFIFGFALLFPIIPEPASYGFINLLPLLFGIVLLSLWKFPKDIDIYLNK